MKTKFYLFGSIIFSFLIAIHPVSAETNSLETACNDQNPESALFSNNDLPANRRPAPGKHFSITGTAKSIADNTTVSSVVIWKPDLCSPVLVGIEQKLTLLLNAPTSQQTLVGVAWKNVSVTVIHQDGKIGGILSATTSF